VCGARARRSDGVAPGMAARRRAPLKRLAGAAGNQAALRRFPLLQRQSADDPAQKPDPNQELKPEPKPLIPLGSDWKLDPSGSHPGAPTPYDKPGPGAGGAGGSLEDVHKGWNKLFGPKPGLTPLAPAQAPPCSVTLQYPDFKSYETTRKLFHGPLDKEPWPQLTEDQFNKARADCKPQAAPPLQAQPVKPSLPIPPAGPKGDFPPSTLPKGQAYA